MYMLLRVIKFIFTNDIRLVRFKKYLSYKTGIYAENLVIIFMFFKGYRLIKHRYRNYAGEIDLIFLRFKVVIFVEVKARTGDIDYFGLVSCYQKSRIIRASEVFLAKYDKRDKYTKRFDVCVVNSIIPWKIKHMKNIWDV